MTARLDAALPVVPELAPYADGLRAAYDAASAALDELAVQRIHGDLHLGQTMRTVLGWKIVDFEGEPAKPLAERRAARLPLARRRRDDAVLRLRRARRGAHLRRRRRRGAAQRAYRAEEWAARNQRRLPRRRTPAASSTAGEQALLAAYVADKAVYEMRLRDPQPAGLGRPSRWRPSQRIGGAA